MPLHARLGGRLGTGGLVGLGFCCLFLVAQLGRTDSADGHVMFSVSQSIVEHGRIWVEPQVSAVAGVGGHHYSKYGIGLSALGVIPYALAHPFASLTGNPEAVEEGAVVSLMPIVAALLMVALYRLGRRLGAGARPAIAVAAAAVLGTYALPYFREFFSEPLVALLVVISFERLLARRPATAAAALSAAALVRPQMFALAPFFLLVAVQYQGLGVVKRVVPPLLVGVGISIWWNVARFDDPFQFGYPGEGFTNPFFDGARTLLFTSDKSLFVFAPVVVLLPFALRALWRQRAAFWLLTANALVVFVLAATWSSPGGGWSWGPRLLLVGLLPAVAALAPWLERGGVVRRRVTGALCVAGFAVSVPAAIVPVPMQQLDPGGAHKASPTIGRQFELIGPTVRYDLTHIGKPRPVLNRLNQRRLPVSWQLGAGSELGKGAFVASLIPTLLLMGIAAWALLALRSRVWPGPSGETRARNRFPRWDWGQSRRR